MSYAVEAEPPLTAAVEELQVQLLLLEQQTRNNPPDTDGDIDFAYSNMALLSVAPLMEF